nr:hypothetical protein CFP56_25849 [Quercus suber]
MEEDPKHHDFDQRHDGPLQVDSSMAKAASYEAAADDVQSPASLKSPDDHPRTPSGSIQSPASGRKSVQFDRGVKSKEEIPPLPAQKSTSSGRVGEDVASPAGRKSLETSGRRSADYSRRDSRDFDVRRDGPFGRPSMTMSRRRSSGIGASPDPLPPTLNPLETTGDESSAQPPVSVDTLHSSDPAFEPEPPPLNYDLWSRKWWIAGFWGLIVIDCVAMPIALYFGLHYGTTLSPNTVFSIVTAALGGVSIFEYVLRFWRLWAKGSKCRVIGARRSYLDWFHWNFSLGWVIIMVELIVGTVPEHPPIRLLAMPVPSMMYAFGTELLVVDLLRYFEVPAPVRISSIPKGSQLRPCVYSVIEDVCAVDGSGGTAYREALNKRYEASHVFRAMLRRLGAFWAFGAETMAVVLTILIFTIDDEAAYVVGWAVPFVWAGIWAAITIWYVKKKLKEEKIAWSAEVAAKSAA